MGFQVRGLGLQVFEVQGFAVQGIVVFDLRGFVVQGFLFGYRGFVFGVSGLGFHVRCSAFSLFVVSGFEVSCSGFRGPGV